MKRKLFGYLIGMVCCVLPGLCLAAQFDVTTPAELQAALATAGSMCHELNQPLTVLATSVNILNKQAKKQEGPDTETVLQVALELLLLRLPASQSVFLALNRVMHTLMDALNAGTSFVFGYVGGGDPPFEVLKPAQNYVFGIQSLPFIILISALAAVMMQTIPGMM